MPTTYVDSQAGFRPGSRGTRAFCAYFMDGPHRGSIHPFKRVHWCSEFNDWLARRWYDNNAALACLSPEGPNAGDPQLLPLVLIGRVCGVFDLSDPLTLSFFLEYLHERPTRLRLWRRFEREHGRQRALYWRNALGLAWESQQASQ